MRNLTHDRLREVMHYDPITGVFTWLVKTSNRVKVGQIAGNTSGHVYERIRIDGELYYAHRLAVFYMTGEWPKNKIDHRDTTKLNNGWDNLREATNRENSANVPVSRNNILGIKGVSREGKGYRAQISVGGRCKYLGHYTTPEEAQAAYVAAANDNFGDFARAA